MSEQTLNGSCLCGIVRYQVQSPWLRFMHCHCSRCRKATGSGHATNLFARPDRLTWTSGESLVVRYDLPTAVSFATCFCRQCGAPVPHLTRNGHAWVIPAGSLDDAPDFVPQSRIHWASRAPWSCESGELPTFEGAPGS
jgi:hypothetical protein